jgi:hypothetical protein
MMRIAPVARLIASGAARKSEERARAHDLDQPLLRVRAISAGVLRGDFAVVPYRDFTVAELLWTGFPAA